MRGEAPSLLAPVVLLIYYVTPCAGGTGCCWSSTFFMDGEPVYIVITVIDYTHGILVGRCKRRGDDRGARLAVCSRFGLAPGRIGMGKMLGFDFPANFNYPYISASITEFWRRWHMTLSGWFRKCGDPGVLFPDPGEGIPVGGPAPAARPTPMKTRSLSQAEAATQANWGISPPCPGPRRRGDLLSSGPPLDQSGGLLRLRCL